MHATHVPRTHVHPMHASTTPVNTLASENPWLRRVQSCSLLLHSPLPPTATANRCLRDHLRSQNSSGWEAPLAPYLASDNVSARGRRRGPGPPVHINPLRQSLALCSSPLPILRCCGVSVSLFALWQAPSLPLCRLALLARSWCVCPRQNREVNITAPLPSTAGGHTLLERRWRWVQNFLFNCKASPLGCPGPTDLS
jgi:hypothetical protein